MLEAFDQVQINDAIEVIAISGNRNSKGVLRAVRHVDDDTGISLGLCGYDCGS